MGVTLNCQQCGNEFEAKRKTAKFCTDNCKVAFSRGKEKEFEALPVEAKLSTLEERLGFEIDRTKAFTPEQQEKVNKLPRHLMFEAMARPNSGDRDSEGKNTVMKQEEIVKHYKSSNYRSLA